jgi:predicted RNA-binding protein YlqC (UPF0109 family)
MKADLKAYTQLLIEPLAEYPKAVKISSVMGRQTTVLEIRCDSRDLGRLIGRSGRTIGAIQILVSSLAAREKQRVVVEIVQ